MSLQDRECSTNSSDDHVLDLTKNVAYTPLQDEENELSYWIIYSSHIRECLAEFFGTFIMIMFGFGVNHQVALSNEKNGTWLSINLCWGIGVMLGVHCSEGVSGAHLNPAVTITMAVYNRLPWHKVPGYILAQCLGAFVAASCIYLIYYPWIELRDPDRMTGQVHFATYPNPVISNYTAFCTEFFATAMLLVGVFCITDKRNRPAHPSIAPLHFMVLIWAIGMAFGMNTGYAINPARDFAPRVFTSLAGWGTKVFTLRNYYFWIPIVAPICGGIVGGGAYKLFVEIHHPRSRQTVGLPL